MPRTKNNRHFPNQNRGKGMEHVSVLVRDSFQDAAARQGFATSMILTGWKEIAGPAIASISMPVRIAFNRRTESAALILKVAGPYSQEVGMNAPRLIERINASYGYKAIESIKITQVGSLQNGAEPAPGRPRPRRKPDAAELERLAVSVADIEDETLRNQLLGLGKSVLERTG